MKQGFTFGNELIRLNEVGSTNTFLQELAMERTLLEGVVVMAENQTQGRGQRGNNWETEPGKNLTFSLLLKPNMVINEQFLISKVVALGIFDFLMALKVKKVKIKWPNDILIDGKKVAGVLIENTLKQNKIFSTVVGIGLNLNQTNFFSSVKATSLLNELSSDIDIDEALDNLLIYLERRYVQLKSLQYFAINRDYLTHLYGYQIALNYQIENQVKKGIITGVSSEGKLQLQINGVVEEFGMKEVSFIL